ncbi:hypothetical protein C8J56DRAFT_888521 [Mycena floridula]|nr:hypothetical protein C8J56DRAFT_888521 [Mycena floridula]
MLLCFDLLSFFHPLLKPIMPTREMQEFTDLLSGQVFELPIFYLEGIIRQPEGLEEEIQRIYEETASEVPHGDPIPARDVLLLTPREGEDWLRRFWQEANEACRPDASFDRDNTSIALPRVIVRFPYDPEMFVDQKVWVRFSVRSYDRRYNMITLLPSFVELFGPEDLDVTLYLCSSQGYCLETFLDLHPETEDDVAVDAELKHMLQFLPAWRR